MTRTPTSYRETLFGILPQPEIEQIITDNLALVQKYSIRHSTKLTLNQATVQQLHRLLAGNLYDPEGVGEECWPWSRISVSCAVAEGAA